MRIGKYVVSRASKVRKTLIINIDKSDGWMWKCILQKYECRVFGLCFSITFSSLIKEKHKLLNGATVKREKVCLDPKWKNCGYIYRGIGCNNCPKFGYKPD